MRQDGRQDEREKKIVPAPVIPERGGCGRLVRRGMWCPGAEMSPTTRRGRANRTHVAIHNVLYQICRMIFPGGRHEPGAMMGSVKIHNEVMKMTMRLFSG